MPRTAWVTFTAMSFLLIANSAVVAQNGRGAAADTRLPNGRPFTAVQQQIDNLQSQIDAVVVAVDANTASVDELGAVLLALEVRVSRTDANVADLQAYQSIQDALIARLTARWDDAEARLAQAEGDVRLLLQADQALQALIAALELDADADAATLAALQAEVANKQRAISQSCPAGSSIRQITSTGTVICEIDDAGSGGTLLSMDLADSFRTANPGLTTSSQVYCPSGYIATGGGLHKDLAMDVYYSAPSGNGWQVAAQNPTTTPRSIRAFVKCARLAP